MTMVWVILMVPIYFLEPEIFVRIPTDWKSLILVSKFALLVVMLLLAKEFHIDGFRTRCFNAYILIIQEEMMGNRIKYLWWKRKFRKYWIF
jgi:hypothetical protein